MTDFVYFSVIFSIGLIIYVYAGYPLALYLLTSVYKRPHGQSDHFDHPVTLIVSCYNEAEVIQGKIDNCLQLDYPAELLDILFVSDGSDDGTDEIIKSNSDPRIRLIRQEGRLGKTSGLNLAVPEARGEFVVFSDANAMYETDAIKKLVRNFVDDDVGYVVGAAIYTDGSASSAAESENSYWEYELAIKKMESDLGSVVGGDGAIYAIRKSLYTTLDRRDINDFVNPLQIVARGYRGLFDPQARCLEETANDFRKEARRKERIVNRSFRGLMKVRQVLNPFVSPLFAWQVISHKLLRWLIPAFLLVIAAGSILLSYQGLFAFQVLYVLETLFLWLAIVGYIKQHQERIPRQYFYPFYFLMVNYYSLVGILRALRGDIQVTWASPRTAMENPQMSGFEKLAIAILFVLPVYIFLDFI